MLGGEIPRVVPYSMGPDRVVLDDVTRTGLHRRHAVRYGGMPNVAGLLKSIPKASRDVAHWEWVDENGNGHMYLVWKEGE